MTFEAREAALKNFLNAASPASAFGRSRVPTQPPLLFWTAIEPPKSRSLFSCDRLIDAHVVARLLERPVAADPAELLDFEALEPAGSGLILLFASDGARAAGALYRKLSDEDFARLDAFQGALEGLTFRELGRVEQTVWFGVAE